MKQEQLDIFKENPLKTGRGGFRKNAGRKKIFKEQQTHLKRPNFDKRHPLHVTLKLKQEVKVNLRRKKYYQVFKASVLKAREKGFKIIHFSIQSNHLHMILESEGKEALSKSMQSFAVSFAKRLNGKRGKKGSVFRDRYFAHILKTPTEVKRTLVYVFQNWAQHTKIKWRFDPYSSLLGFKDKIALGLGKVNTKSPFPNETLRLIFREELREIISPPGTWLLNWGWKKSIT